MTTKKNLFGFTGAPIPHEDYQQIYETTGLDLDDRLYHFKVFMEFYVDKRNDFACFCKDLPHFHKFQDVDQNNITTRKSSGLI